MNDEMKIADELEQDLELDDAQNDALLSIDENAGESFFEKIKAFFSDCYKKYDNNLAPDNDDVKVTAKKAYIKLGAAFLAFAILVAGIIMFLTMYPYYTTGVTVDEFIERFNSIITASNSDIAPLIADYQEITIPEGTKLGGKDKIELLDGQVVISAKTRGKKIVDLYVNAVNLKGYDPSIYYFNVDGENYEYVYFFMAYGKIMAAFDAESARIIDSDTAANNAFSQHYSAIIGLSYGGDLKNKKAIGSKGECTLEYDLETLDMTITPTKTHIADEIIWPEIDLTSGVTDMSVNNGGNTNSVASDISSSSDTVSSGNAQ